MDPAEMAVAEAKIRAAMQQDGVAVDVPGFKVEAQPRSDDGRFVAPTAPVVPPVADQVVVPPVDPAAVPPAAPAPQTEADKVAFDRAQLQRRYKYLGDEETADVAADVASGRIDEVYQRARDHERQKGKVHDLTERLTQAEADKQAAAQAAQQRAIDLYRNAGYDLVQDPTSPTGYKVVPNAASQPRAGTQAAQDQELAALRARADETGNVDDFTAYTAALETRVANLPKEIDARLEAKLDARLAREREEALARSAAESETAGFKQQFDGAMSSFETAFAKAGPNAAGFRDMAVTAARHAATQPGATIETCIAAARKVAALASGGSVSPSAQVPRPAAPTVVPRGGVPASPSASDMRPQLDTSTADGKAKAVAHLMQAMPKVLGREPTFR